LAVPTKPTLLRIENAHRFNQLSRGILVNALLLISALRLLFITLSQPLWHFSPVIPHLPQSLQATTRFLISSLFEDTNLVMIYVQVYLQGAAVIVARLSSNQPGLVHGVAFMEKI
jgi:hypothetical protein